MDMDKYRYDMQAETWLKDVDHRTNELNNACLSRSNLRTSVHRASKNRNSRYIVN